MKTSKKLFILTLILIVALSLTGCGFVEYHNDKMSPDTLASVKTEYIEKLRTETSADNYREREKKLYSYELRDGINEINEGSTAEEIIATYDKHFDIIGSIKTDEEYKIEEWNKYKSDTKALISGYVNLDDYREDKKAEVNNLIKTYCASVDTSTTKVYVDRAYTDYVSEVNKVQTAEQYKAEVENLKQSQLNVMQSQYSSSLYTDNQRQEINAITYEYKTCADMVSEKENVVKLYEIAVGKLKRIVIKDDVWQEKLQKFNGDLIALYGADVLKMPSCVLSAVTGNASYIEVKDYTELASVIDYFTFYQTSGNEFLCGDFRVKPNFTYADIKEVVNIVYWECELLRSGAGIHAFSDGDYIRFELVPYDLASKSNKDKYAPLNKYDLAVDYDSDKSVMKPRAADFDDFAYKNYTAGSVKVWNSQQLWYALEHEYIPDCASGSPAELCLNKAKEILREIILDGMSNDEKAFTIYKWFAKNVRYDVHYHNFFQQSVLEVLPEASCCNSLLVEGGILDNLGVCEGYAKPQLLLLRIEGIESYRLMKGSKNLGCEINYDLTGQTGDWYAGYGSHAFVIVKMSDGKFYLSGSSGTQLNENQSSLHMLAVAPNLFTAYCGLLSDYSEAFANSFSNVYSHLTINGVPLFVNNAQGVRAVIDEFNRDTTRKQTSIFCDGKTYEAVAGDIVSDILSIDSTLSYVKNSADNGKQQFIEIVIYREDAVNL